MRRAIGLATSVFALTGEAALAQGSGSSQPPPASSTTPASAAQAPAAAPGQQGVLVFEPSFFTSANPDNALDMISRLPGFGLDTGNEQRGFAGTAGNVLIDGARPSSKTDRLDQILSRISAESVERIELIRGGAPGIDMQGRSVVANVVLKKAVQVERVAELNTYFYPDGYVGPIVRFAYSRRDGDNQIEGAILATTDRTGSTGEGYRRRFDPAGALIQDADLDLWDHIWNIDARGAVQRRIAGGKLRLNAVLLSENFDRTIDTRITSGAGLDTFTSEEERGLEGEVGLSFNRTLGPRSEIEFTALQSLDQEDFASGSREGTETTAFTAATLAGESIVRGVWRFRRSERWSYESGAEAAYNFLDSDTGFSANGVPVPLPSASVKVEELRGEAFAQTTWRANPKVTVEAGVRVEVSEISQSGDTERSEIFVYPKPRFQLTWTPAQGHQLRFRAERQVDQLDFGDFAASAEIDLGQVEAGNPDLEPSKRSTFEIVYERRFWGEGVLELTGQYTRVQDVIDIIPLVGGFEAVGNIGDGESLFFQSRLTLPLDRFGMPNARLQNRIGLADTRVTDPVTGEERRFQGNAPVTCGLSYNQDLKGGRWAYGFDTNCVTVKARQYRVRQVFEFDNEPFATLFGQWKPRPDLTVRAEVGNATDRETRRFRDVYSGPRNTAPLVFREERGVRTGPWLFLKIRKTL